MAQRINLGGGRTMNIGKRGTSITMRMGSITLTQGPGRSTVTQRLFNGARYVTTSGPIGTRTRFQWPPKPSFR